MGEPYFTFQLMLRTGKPCRLGENKGKGDCGFMSSSDTPGWVGAQAKVQGRLTRRPWESSTPLSRVLKSEVLEHHELALELTES